MKVTIVIGALAVVTKGLVKGLEDLEIRGREKTIQTRALQRGCQNTEKSHGNLKRLAVTQTPMENYHLTLV